MSEESPLEITLQVFDELLSKAPLLPIVQLELALGVAIPYKSFDVVLGETIVQAAGGDVIDNFTDVALLLHPSFSEVT